MAPVVVVAAAEVGTAVAASQTASAVTRTVARGVAQAELQAAKSSALSFGAGVIEGGARAFASDNGMKSLPAAAPAPNDAWKAGRMAGSGLYYGIKILAAQYGVTW